MPRLLEATWRTKMPLVLILCEPSALRHNAHGSMLVEASARTNCPTGADGVQDKFAHHYKHEPRLSEAPWRSKAAMVPMLCQLGASSSTRQGPKLV